MPTIFYNGKIYSMDESSPSPRVVLVNDRGLVHWTGDMDSLPTIGRLDKLKRVNLEGRTLIPGFNDAHVHIWKLGLLLTTEVDARRANAPDISSIVARFQAKAHQVPHGKWLTGRGYNEADLPERRHLTRYDLDAASAQHPVALTRTCGHMIVANSLALQLAGITAETPDPPGGVIVRDDDGEPTGLLQETAMGLITGVVPEPDDEIIGNAIREANYHQLRLGITSATDPLLMPSHLRVYRQLETDGDLAVRVNGMPIRRPDGGTETLPLPEPYLSSTLRIDTVKFFADGGLSGATAAISEPYNVTGTYGVLRFETEELFELMWEAHEAGFRIGTHAIGDVALDQVIAVYEELYRRSAGQRHRIEHLGLPSAEHLQRCAAMGVIAVPQTVFLPALGSAFRRYLPESYFPCCYPVRSMLEAGLTVALSSDAPVVPDDNPLLGIKAAVDRQDANGGAIAPEQAITTYDALYAYTMGGAIASGDADNRGSITPDKWADLVVLSGDPLNTPPEELLSIKVEQTYVGGQLVYEA
jgi:predicted amidohydrolase YtcJ